MRVETYLYTISGKILRNVAVEQQIYKPDTRSSILPKLRFLDDRVHSNNIDLTPINVRANILEVGILLQNLFHNLLFGDGLISDMRINDDNLVKMLD